MPMTPKQMITLLEENGFKEIRQDGSHKFFKIVRLEKLQQFLIIPKT